MEDKISIIGAGIGGLTTAIILKQKGLNVNVFESATDIRPIGAGILIANNAMQVFKKIGIHNKIQKAGYRISHMKITDTRLKTISKVDLTEYENKYGVYNIAIHRGKLQQILVDELGIENIKLSKRLCKIERKELFNMTFEDNSFEKSKIIIGADGIKSVVRNQLFNENTLRTANQICWRGICEIDLPEKYNHEFNEAWGKGKRFGFVKICSKKVYWYALTNSKKIKQDEVNLLDLFKEFHPDILSVISLTPEKQIIKGEIIDLKPIYKWQKKNVCLIGDAAHAATPNLGQGACQAIEDAYVLGSLFEKETVIENTFKEYETLRLKKAHSIVNISWKIGKIAQMENPISIWLRNIILRSLPKSLNKKQMEIIFNIKYF